MTEKLIQPNWLSRLMIINLIIIVAGLAIVLAKRNLLPEKVPLLYSRPWGEEQLASKDWLFLIPASSLILLAGQSTISRFLQKRNENFLPYVLSGSSLLFSLLGIITLVKIILLLV